MRDRGYRRVALRVDVLVVDEPALRRFAADRYRASWEKPLPDRGLCSIVLEALVVSNANPNPIDYGLELIDCGPAGVSADDRTPATVEPLVSCEVELAVIDETAVRAFVAQHPDSRLGPDVPIET